MGGATSITLPVQAVVSPHLSSPECCPMVRRAFSRFRLLVWFAAVGAALLAPAGAWAQETRLGSKETTPPAFHKNKPRFEILLKGDEKPGPDDRAVADAASQWFIYPMTWNIEYRNTAADFRGGRTLHTHAADLEQQ